MNQRQYAAPIGAPFTSLIFTCKWGNLIYILLGIMLMSMCKNMDNAAHVRYAIEQLGGKT